MKTLCFDLDGVLCSQTDGDYENAVPNREAIEVANRLYGEGYKIIIYTSRFMGRHKGNLIEAYKYKEGYEFTLNQLPGWGSSSMSSTWENRSTIDWWKIRRCSSLATGPRSIRR